MTDLSKKLIERLQGHYASPHHGGCQDCYGVVMDDAAAEIARLTAALSRADAEIAEWKQAAGVEAGLRREFSDKLWKATESLQAMLVDPPATLDEPDRDIEVILKMRKLARAALLSISEPVK